VKKLAYYKGCLASLSAKELDISTRALAPKVGYELIELESVTCCGAGDIHEAEPDYYLHLNARILSYAEATGCDTLMTVCNVCTLNLRQANYQLQIDEVYDISRLPGFGKRDALYAELEASWDTRRPANRFDGQGMRGAGHLVSVFGGRYEGLADNTINFYRGGFDLQQFVALTQGPRALEFRVFAEAVTGPRDEIPFLELPRLGGQRLLRGYNIDRFRDKVAAVGQVGYLFSLSRYVAMTIFADVGRVYADVDALTWRDQRVGFGTALEIYSSTGMVARAEIAGSADGSVFAYLSLDPVFDTRARTDRR